MNRPFCSTDNQYISELESLRGLAITFVLFFHIHSYFIAKYIPNTPRLYAKLCLLITEGHTGVTLFFILSAFLLSTPFLKEINGGAAINKKNYFKRRFLRIMPLYTLSVIAGVMANINQPDVVLKGIKALLFVPGSGGLNLQPFGITWWSLATEIQFYILLPLLFMGFSDHRFRKLTCLLFTVYAVTYILFILKILTIPNANLIVLGHTLFGRLPIFLTGIFAAMIYLKYGHAIKTRLAPSKGYIGDLSVLMCLFALSALLTPIHRMGYFRADIHYVFWHIGEGMIWAMILLLFLLAPFNAKPLFCNRFMGHLGTLSYSIYLWHLPIIVWGGKLNQRWGLNFLDHSLYFFLVFIPLLIAAILLISRLSYRYIELPFLIRKARI